MKAMVQFGLWGNCPNNCDFCLRLERRDYTHSEQLEWIRNIKENIKTIDWKNEFEYGISLLGGELYYIKNREVQLEFLDLIDTIIETIIKPSDTAQYSTVTNGLYNPEFLFEVLDKFKNTVGMDRVDINFSYDLKYRYANEKMRQKALSTIYAVRDRYNYTCGVQMILTQHLINLWKEGKWDINEFMEKDIPGCRFSFLYPHPINTGKILFDFFFNRKDFLDFLMYLRNANFEVYLNFINSTKNSGTFKYTGMRYRADGYKTDQKPILSDGKEEIASCGHSKLYRCYADSDKCVLCDLQLIEGEF